MFRHQVGVVSHSVAGAFNLYDDGVVQQFVEQSGSHHRIPEDITPLGEAAVRGQNQGAFFISGVDQLEEQVGR